MKKNSFLKNLVMVFSKTLRWKKSLLFVWMIHILLSGLSIFMIPILIKVIVSQIENGVNFEGFISFMVAYSCFFIILYLTTGFCENKEVWSIDFLKAKFTEGILRKTLTIDYEKLETPEILDLQQKAINAVKDNSKGIPGMLSSISKVGILLYQTLFASLLIMRLNPLLLFVLIILTFLQFLYINHIKEKDKKEVWDYLAPYWRKLFHLNRLTRHYEYAKDIRLYNMSESIYNKQIEVDKNIQKVVYKSRKLWAKSHLLSQSIKLLQEVILYSYLVYCYLTNRIQISDFIFYISAITSFQVAMSSFLWEFAVMNGQSLEVNDYLKFVNLEKDKTEKKKLRSIDDLLAVKSEYKFEFKFENVSFKYINQNKYALKNVNLKIDNKTKLAIVGVNGAGKTTLIKLLCRLYEPTEGRILLNGIDIREYDKESYFKIFSPVFQNVELYPFLLLENISMKNFNETNLEMVKKCIEKAGFNSKIGSLKYGINSEVTKVFSSEGVDFSGGEKQKIALCRALYKNAPVILLDEPTAAMDALAEYDFYKKINDIVDNKTAIYISHRLSSTQFCDAIAVFQDGQMVEYGAHDELMKLQGKYYELFEVQAKYYKE